jgi:hypothetical protein
VEDAVTAEAWQWIAIGLVIVFVVALASDLGSAASKEHVEERLDRKLRDFEGSSAVVDGRRAFVGAEEARLRADAAHRTAQSAVGSVGACMDEIEALRLEIKVLRGEPLPDPEPPMVAPGLLRGWDGAS